MDIKLESLTEQFVALIRSMILNNELKAGEQIPTQQIAQQYGVSVMPIRSALRELTERKLVVNRARVGFFVCDYSIEELLEIAHCRRMYETYSLEFYFPMLVTEHLRALYDRIQQNVGDRFDLREYQDIDLQLHSSFILASKNGFLINQYKQLSDLFSLGIRYDKEDSVSIRLSSEEHIRILDAILHHDLHGALRELNQHLDRSEQIILEKEKKTAARQSDR